MLPLALLNDHLPLPLSLYLHFPWCVRKCPYCDFNSHTLSETLPEITYIERLLQELESYATLLSNTPLTSIFCGGGTPSLFSGSAIQYLFESITAVIENPPGLEITLEANPGTLDESHFAAYLEAGINRLSLGVQSFNPTQLQNLGRIHTHEQAQLTFRTARALGFTNINIDLMFGLPHQSIENALVDLEEAIILNPEHISWYQLTIEPNTYFYRYPPPLPESDSLFDMQQAGIAFLQKAGYTQYEVSAYAKPGYRSQHNLNYWNFGDYLGLGAGAHGKLSAQLPDKIVRYRNVKLPKEYLDITRSPIAEQHIVPKKDVLFEFMLNALRLNTPISFSLLIERTGFCREELLEQLQPALTKEFLSITETELVLSNLGRRFLNDVITLFLK